MKKITKNLKAFRKHFPNQYISGFSGLVFLLMIITYNISINNVHESKNSKYKYVPQRFSEAQSLDIESKKPTYLKKTKLSVSEKKSQFIAIMTPIMFEINKEILLKRNKIFEIEKKIKTNSLMASDANYLKKLFAEYKIKNNDINELKKRVDIVPVSLAVAQAAIESGWGLSRFAIEGNAFFGQKVVGLKTKGINPAENTNPYIKVRTFRTMDESVRAYVKNLNTYFAYNDFRQSRKEKRSLGKSLDGVILAEKLTKYSELGNEYIKQIKSVIKENNLNKFDYNQSASLQAL